MKTKMIILLVLSFYCVCAQKNSPAPVYNPDKNYTTTELQFDLTILKDAFLKIHPGLFWYQSEKDFEDTYNRLRNGLNSPMTEMQFLTLITPFIANINCSHTDLIMSAAYDRYFLNTQKVFPFGIKINSSKIYLVKNYTRDSTIVTGSRIISINGMTADSILDFMKPRTWADGFTESYARIEHDFEPLLHLYGLFTNPDRYQVKTIDLSGNEKLIDAEALGAKIFEEAWEKDDANRIKGHKPFRFYEADSLNTALIRIDQFEGTGYSRFLAKSFKTLKDKGTKNLIIDVRGNDGGSDGYGRLLYAYIALTDYTYYNHLETTIDDPNDSIFKYGKMPFGKLRFKYLHRFRQRETKKGHYDLKNSAHCNLSKKPFKPRKNNFKGNVFVLADDRSFSTTTEFCAIARYNKRATFIGRETGGGYCGNTSGAGFELTLPKTKIRVFIPLIRYYMAVEGACGRGIQPDYARKEEIRDLILHKDADLLFTLDLIRHSR